jgi:hypothetical protein
VLSVKLRKAFVENRSLIQSISNPDGFGLPDVYSDDPRIIAMKEELKGYLDQRIGQAKEQLESTKRALDYEKRRSTVLS